MADYTGEDRTFTESEYLPPENADQPIDMGLEEAD